ncbi:hypothetical protein D9757_006098 [Collybiopsis confluens]|uniref:NADH:flavin oxidoreductase/NADH oxidase N-terminal domain-containing protein n=1 Tax=Collybiopsis confluens TaxID=2823264 RepID=A0A8H5HHI0_9AGAR|nr:hypothetical protein D9757_006098 [Collybiopsis confluens]
MESNPPALFYPAQIGPHRLLHRVVLAPLTRLRCTKDHVPQDIMVEYYRQRASSPGTLLIGEATLIAPNAAGLAHAPGIWSEDQISGWKKIVNAIHAKNCFIFLQLWALGRSANLEALHAIDPEYSLVSASDLPIKGKSQPRPLTQAEIQEYIRLYATAASNAVNRAGFDGVEIHGANGYLIDQFTQDVSNKRTDEYGGSVGNRCRFALEVTAAVVDAIGQDKTAIRIGPWTHFNDMRMSDPIPTFSYLVSQLKDLYPKLAYLHVIEPGIEGSSYSESTSSVSNDFLREIWLPRPLITAGRYTRETALKTVERSKTRMKAVGLLQDVGGELIAFGKPFLANPDLPVRLEKDLPLNDWNRETFYIPGDKSGKGYTDYPSYSAHL